MRRIENFINCPEVLPTVAAWIHHEFWSDKPGHSVESMLTRISHGHMDSLPIGLVAFDGGTPLGTVSLIESDLNEPTDFSPWLAALYVVPEARSKGIGAQLVQACIDAAYQCGYPTLYLQTSIPEYYERLGWSRVSELPEPGDFVLQYALESHRKNGRAS